MNTVVRTAELADLPRVGQLAGGLVRQHHDFDPVRFILVEGVEQGYERFFSSELGNPKAMILVAEVDGRLVGYSYARLEPRDWSILLDAHGKVHDLFVDAAYRRRGIGRALFGETLARLEGRGAGQIILSTAVQNESAHGLFASFGFRRTMLEMARSRVA